MASTSSAGRWRRLLLLLQSRTKKAAPLLAVLLCALPTAAEVEPVGRLEHEALREISGVVKSQIGDFYWVHNDSGDEARLFAIDQDGTPLVPSWLGVPSQDWQGHAIANAVNFDWEDIALADGVLYVADTGNNGNARRDLGVYVINEPQPTRVAGMRALKYLPLRYPDQRDYPGEHWHFDCEAVFVADGKLHFITKHRQPGQVRSQQAGAKLYRLDTQFTDQQNVLAYVGSHKGLLSVTAADLSPDGNTLAIATYTALWLFDRPTGGDDWLSGPARRMNLDANLWQRYLEAIAWQDDSTLLLITESRDILRAKTSDFVPVN